MNQCPVITSELRPGMIVAQPVISDTGKVLLVPGMALTVDIVNNLVKWQVPFVCIVDEKSSEEQLEFQKIYSETVKVVERTFNKVRIFRQIPNAECREIIKNIEMMVNVNGVADYLYTIKQHSDYTYRHSLNVSILTGILGKWLNYEGKQLRKLLLAGLLHDIGKATIPKDVLDKPGPLTCDEMDIIKLHSQYGYELAANSPDISHEVKLGILHHHERVDGSGYPQGLQSKEIHPYARVVAIADIYDAMTSERVYRKKMTPFRVMEVIQQQMYNQLDPTICFTFVQNIRKQLIGSNVILSNGMTAKVVLMNDNLDSKPMVQLETGALLDLQTCGEVGISAVLD